MHVLLQHASFIIFTCCMPKGEELHFHASIGTLVKLFFYLAVATPQCTSVTARNEDPPPHRHTISLAYSKGKTNIFCCSLYALMINNLCSDISRSTSGSGTKVNFLRKKNLFVVANNCKHTVSRIT